MNFSQFKSFHYNYFFMLSARYISSLAKDLSIGASFFHLFRYAAKFFRSLYRFFRSPRVFLPSECIAFLGISKNNFDAVESIYAILKERAILMAPEERYNDEIYLMPLFIAYLFSLFLLPQLLFFFIRASSHEKKVITCFFPEMMISLGYYHLCTPFLRLLHPKTLVYMNDHSFLTRMIVDRAEKAGIQCFYIQHASVTGIFPKIISSFALLEGEDAKLKYEDAGSDPSKIKLIGMPKLDPHIHFINRQPKVRKLAICTTMSMAKDDVTNMVHMINEKFPDLQLFFRTHPAEKKYKNYKEMCELPYLLVSDSKSEDVFTFLKQVDAVISGNSSILLEAALLNVFPIYYTQNHSTRWNDQPYDKYGYVRQGVVYPASNFTEIEEILNKLQRRKPYIRNKTKFYCDTIGTRNEGESSHLAAGIILQAIGGDVEVQ